MAENDMEALAAWFEQEIATTKAQGCKSLRPTIIVLDDAQTILTALRSTTAEPNPAPAEGDLPDDDWVPSPFTGNRLGTHPTDSAAKDAEIAAYREALEKIRGYSDPNGMTRRRMKAIAVAALANRGEAGALAKGQGE